MNDYLDDRVSGKDYRELKSALAKAKAGWEADYKISMKNLNSFERVAKENDALRSLCGELVEYAAHEQDCIRMDWESGEPTKDGGYRTMYRGKWYQSKPIDETPKCECGADDLVARAQSLLSGGGKAE